MFWYNTKIIQNSSNKADPVTMRCEPHHNAKFVRNTLEKFRTTDASQLCITDKVIQKVGYRHYCLRRCHESKQDERKSVRQEITELARILLQFRSTATKLDMDCSNLETELSHIYNNHEDPELI